ncbi:fluoride efflux transporter CrcB [Sphingobacterium rhinopitheci]|uniref:fluoride efflux transporter CrcB n=1 Tax=Sphingobacterium rhinopitheci TaxID=2781960 RepID=UPI001F52382A|nr:fluoride efflux transporter CrcB [Sphingobacterium rhinopitheci]MCI0921926.1 fluoride efflux transporter CrcB [Sphingobacterium rhinopitheci]
MNRIVFVFLGGGIGSICRHFISLAFTNLSYIKFPIATFITNVVGCFIIGLLVGKLNLSNKLNLLLVTGFCGGFTTFSTFSKESLTLIVHNEVFLALFYMATSVAIGILLVRAGYAITSKKQQSIQK